MNRTTDQPRSRGSTLVSRLAAILLVALAASLAAPCEARALVSCGFTVSTIDFGSSIDGFAGSTVDTTGTLSISCSGGIAGAPLLVCPNLGPGSGGTGGGHRIALNGASTLSYDLYQDGSHSTVWGSSWPGGSGSPPVISLTLNGSGAVSTTRTIYARAFVSGATTTGLYTSSFAGGATTFVYGGVNILCSVILFGTAATPSFTVTGQVVSSCAISAGDLSFGSAGALTANIDATSTILLTCNQGTAYSVALNGGNAAAAPTARQMAHGTSHVTYGLYRDAARSLPWGDSGGTTLGGTGTGSAQSLTVRGRVPPQATPLSGLYSDVVIATVTY